MALMGSPVDLTGELVGAAADLAGSGTVISSRSSPFQHHLLNNLVYPIFVASTRACFVDKSSSLAICCAGRGRAPFPNSLHANIGLNAREDLKTWDCQLQDKA
jgi:hypothetical protein